MKATTILLIALLAIDLAMTVVNMWRTASLITKIANETLLDTKVYVGGCQDGELNVLRGIQSDIDGLSKSIRHINNKIDPPPPKIIVREENRDVIELHSIVDVPAHIHDVPGDEIMEMLAADLAAQIAPIMETGTYFDVLSGCNVTSARIRIVKEKKDE